MKFTVPGEPKAKLRPRLAVRGFTYTPAKTVEYENFVKMCYMEQVKMPPIIGVPIKMQVKAYFTIPESASKKKKNLMSSNVIRPTKTPDIDNIIKAIADSLNGIAYKDDTQIVEIMAEKFYSEQPRVEVELWPMR